MFRMLMTSVAAGALAMAASAQTTVTLLSTNDVDQFESFAGLSGVVAAERAAGENVLFLHAGDSLSPSVLAGLDKGDHMVDLLNLISPDFMTVGNHEFDFGPDVLENAIAKLNFPMLAGNIAKADGSTLPGTQASSMVEIDGFKIGIFGLTSPETAFKSSPGDYGFAPSIATAEALAAGLRADGADIVIALVHLNQAEDFALVSSGAADVVITGDDHNQLTYYNGKVAMMESGEQAEVVTALDLTLERDDDDVEWSPSFRILDTSNVAATADVGAKIAALNDQLDASLGEVIGTTATAMDTTRPVIRGMEATFGNLVVDAMRVATGADMALTNGGGIRAKATYAPGQALTAGDIMRELPFGNKTVVLEITGQQVIDAVENGVSGVENGAGRFPHISGFAFVADLSQPAGERVTAVTIDGMAIDPTATFTLATNDYIARGGDNYQSFAAATTVLAADDSVLMASQVIDYIRAAGEVAPMIEGRIMLK